MKWLREPLVHFLALGAALFLLFAVFGAPGQGRSDRIVVPSNQVALLADGFRRTWQRPPTAAELAGLVEDHIREEIYYREALKMGLDSNDTIVRRRMRQKMEFFTDDLLALVQPSEEDLRDYLSGHEEAFRIEPRMTLAHVYFNLDQRGEGGLDDAKQLRTRLRSAQSDVDLTQLGDPLPLPTTYRDVSLSELAGRFGSVFADRLMGLPVGTWEGPIESGFGLHLVLIENRKPGRIPSLEAVRQAVEREWRSAARSEAKEAFFESLRSQYSIVVEPLGATEGEDDAAPGGSGS